MKLAVVRNTARQLPVASSTDTSIRQARWWIQFTLDHQRDHHYYNLQEPASWAMWWMARLLAPPMHGRPYAAETARQATHDTFSVALAFAATPFSGSEWLKLWARIDQIKLSPYNLVWEMSDSDEDRPLAAAWMQWFDSCQCDGEAPKSSCHVHICLTALADTVA